MTINTDSALAAEAMAGRLRCAPGGIETDCPNCNAIALERDLREGAKVVIPKALLDAYEVVTKFVAHNEMDHDFIKDEKKCPKCKALAELEAAKAGAP